MQSRSRLVRTLAAVRQDIRAVVASAGASIWSHGGTTPGPEVVLEDVVALADGWLAIGRLHDEIAIAPVVVDGAGPRRARVGDGMFAAALGALRTEVPGLRPRPVASHIPPTGPERGFEVDQTNQSVIVGDAAVVKLLSRTSPGAQPGVDLPAHLAAVGFDEIPPPVGSLWWRGALVSTISTYLPGARDGWEWYVDLVVSAANGEAAWGVADAPAGAIGGLVARLHRALATPSTVFSVPVVEADRAETARWRAAAESTLKEALAVTSGAEGERLAARASAVRNAFEAFDRVDRTPVMRIHGDLHVGQVMLGDDGALRVGDFDGNPMTPASARNAPHAAARDVASMACAIDHVGRVAARQRPRAGPSIEAWIERSRVAFLEAYREGLGDLASLFDERLFVAFAVAQEAHEFTYAARYLRRWQYVPDAAMPAVLAWAGDAR
jgi:maltokinase